MPENMENSHKKNVEDKAGLFQEPTEVDQSIMMNFPWSVRESERERRLMGDPDSRKPKE